MNLQCRLISLQRSILTMARSKVYAISDLHVDMKENQNFVESWSAEDNKRDILIVAGDVTDRLDLLESTLAGLKQKFKEVFYVTGNHELWIRRETLTDSISKFHHILEMCSRLGVKTQPALINLGGSEADPEDDEDKVWIVPLFSWYSKPEDDLTDSLYYTTSGPRREDPKLSENVWMDNFLCQWSELPSGTVPSKYFSDLNENFITTQTIEAPVVSFSHFVPRLDLVLQTEEDLAEVNKFRFRHHLGEAPKFQGGMKGFNFTRYAGSKRLEDQIRRLKSTLHIYGHQHRNRDRIVEGIRYVSHCLGNLKEQKDGWTWGIEDWKGPKQVWPQIANEGKD